LLRLRGKLIRLRRRWMRSGVRVLGGAGVAGPMAGDFFLYFMMGSWTLVHAAAVLGFLQAGKRDA
jgi:hypothetical protein